MGNITNRLKKKTQLKSIYAVLEKSCGIRLVKKLI